MARRRRRHRSRGFGSLSLHVKQNPLLWLGLAAGAYYLYHEQRERRLAGLAGLAAFNAQSPALQPFKLPTLPSSAALPSPVVRRPVSVGRVQGRAATFASRRW
jgi:hypothetical protein